MGIVFKDDDHVQSDNCCPEERNNEGKDGEVPDHTVAVLALFLVQPAQCKIKFSECVLGGWELIIEVGRLITYLKCKKASSWLNLIIISSAVTEEITRGLSNYMKEACLLRTYIMSRLSSNQLSLVKDKMHIMKQIKTDPACNIVMSVLGIACMASVALVPGGG